MITKSATELGRLMAAGELTSEELTRACLDRIEALNPTLNAIVFRRPRAELMDLAWTVARRVAKGAPLAQQAVKEVLRAVDGLPDREAMGLRAQGRPELATFEKMLNSQDMIEGQRAFLEKREPRWTGR